jgi:hypothetical protein
MVHFLRLERATKLKTMGPRSVTKDLALALMRRRSRKYERENDDGVDGVRLKR